ncbi:MAG: glycoside hydrolase family 13 protein [Anaerolineaceae bacterium]|nr:glycoside hydrolase family 13 protein [Anaerolineaceae bacterium]
MNEFPLPKWVTDAIFYQIFPERFANGDPSNDPASCVAWESKPEVDSFFGGDLEGIRQKIPYLKALGVNALYLTPIFKAGTNHKYDTIDYMQIDPHFGDLALFKQLVEEVHEAGMRVILDGVFNHCGDKNLKFLDALEKGPKSRWFEWFVFQEPFENKAYQTCGGAAFLPKLNTANPEVQAYIIDVGLYWLKETGIDGWRLDVPWKTDPALWPLFYRAVKEVNPEAYIVHETWRDTNHWLNRSIGDGVMNYPLRDYIFDYALKDGMDAEDFDYFCRRMAEDYLQAGPYQLNLLGSHDTPRLLTAAGGDVPRTLLALSLLFMMPGAPMLYYGDENGMSGGNDPDCRKGMVWQEKDWNMQIRTRVQQLIRIRQDHKALRAGKYQTLFMHNGVYAFSRQAKEDKVLVICNPRQAAGPILVNTLFQDESWQDTLSGQNFAAKDGKLFITHLEAQSILVLIPVRKLI